MADYENEDEVLIDSELKYSDFVEEDGEVAICVIQRFLYNQKNPNTTQRHQIFYSRCSV